MSCQWLLFWSCWAIFALPNMFSNNFMLVRTACWPQIPCVPRCHIVIFDIMWYRAFALYLCKFYACWCRPLKAHIEVIHLHVLQSDHSLKAVQQSCCFVWFVCCFLFRCFCFCVLFLCLVMLLGEFVRPRPSRKTLRSWVLRWPLCHGKAGGAAWDIRSERTYSWKQESRCWFQRLLIFTPILGEMSNMIWLIFCSWVGLTTTYLGLDICSFFQ